MTLLINYCRSQDASPQVDMLDNHLLPTPSFLIDSSLSLSSPTVTSHSDQMTYLHVSILLIRARSFITNKYPIKKNEQKRIADDACPNYVGTLPLLPILV